MEKSLEDPLIKAFPHLDWADIIMLQEELTPNEMKKLLNSTKGSYASNLGIYYNLAKSRQFSDERVGEELAAAQAAQANANARRAANAASRETRTWKRNNVIGNAAIRKLHKIMEENAANASKKEAEMKAKAKVAREAAKAINRSAAIAVMSRPEKESAIRKIISERGTLDEKQLKLQTMFPFMSRSLAKIFTAPKVDMGRALNTLQKAEAKAVAASVGTASAAASEAIANVLDGGRRRTRRRRTSRRKSMKKRQ
jgi:hypothetical protein